MAMVLGGYRNQHEGHCYPFMDHATLTDNAGWRLPNDFIIDAFLYPIDLTNGLYISSIDTDNGYIYFADTGTDEIHGKATIGDSDVAYVYEPDGIERQIGVITFGDGKLSGLQGNNLREFEVTATALVPTAFVPMNQVGVRSLELDNGDIFIGNVKFKGESGINVKSYVENDINILEIDIVGEAEAQPEECETCPDLTEICVERLVGSAFTVYEYTSNAIGIESSNFNLSTICDNKRRRVLPAADGELPPTGDPCDDDIPCPTAPDSDDVEEYFCFDVSELSNNLFIVAPSIDGELNAVDIQPLHDYSFQGHIQLKLPKRVESVADVADYVDRFKTPRDTGDALAFGFKGLTRYIK